MNEMLGNQYFLARRFLDATAHYERALQIQPLNYEIKKKLIICYIQQNELGPALKLFSDLISENISVIIESDPEKDDCPCLQMISEIDTSNSKLSENEKYIMLGILWLYCDILKSRKYFGKLLEEDPNNFTYQNIYQIINQPYPIN